MAASNVKPVVKASLDLVFPIEKIIFDRENERAFNLADPGQAEVFESIREHGQQVPIHLTKDPETGEVFFDDGMVRISSIREIAKETKTKRPTIMAILWERSKNDPGRDKTHSAANQAAPLSWHEKALLWSNMLSRGASVESIAKQYNIDKKHVQLSTRTRAKVETLVNEKILPNDAFAQLTTNAADVLGSYIPKNGKLGDENKTEIADAYNKYIKSGRMPERKTDGQQGGGGRTPSTGLSLKASVLFVTDRLRKSSEGASSYGDLYKLIESFPCKTPEDAAHAIVILSRLARGEINVLALPGIAAEIDEMKASIAEDWSKTKGGGEKPAKSKSKGRAK